MARVPTNRLLALTLALAISPVVTVFAQEPRKADAEAIARRALAGRLSVPIERIKTVSVTPAEWRDSSLGCPERGKVYMPVLTSGFEVRLRDVDREHVVHVAGGRAVICGSQADSRLSAATLVSAPLKAADAVRGALALRLKIDPARVRIVSTRPARSDSDTCSTAPSKPSGAAFVVEAEAESRTFRYYSDATVTVSCENPA